MLQAASTRGLDSYQPMPLVKIAHPEWSKNATIYQLNTRQFTGEGTFRAAEQHGTIPWSTSTPNGTRAIGRATSARPAQIASWRPGCPIRLARLRRSAAGKAKALGHDGSTTCPS